MGGDQLVPAVAGQVFEGQHGEDATELVRALKEQGLAVALASSGASDHVVGVRRTAHTLGAIAASVPAA